jgi:hypothetical protein
MTETSAVAPTFALAAPGIGPAAYALGVCGFIGLVLVAVVAIKKQSDPLEAAATKGFAWTVGALVTTIVCLVTLDPYFTKVSVTSDRLVVTAWWERESILRTQLNTADARLVDVTSDSALGLAGRVAGTGEPGYASGDWRLRNRSRAHVFITDMHRVLAIPVQGGGWLMISAAQPESLLAAVRSVASTTSR